MKGPGQREGRENRVGGESLPRLRGHTHSPSRLSFAPALSSLRAACSSACWASGRPQAPLATTHRHATRAPSRQLRYRLPRTARAPSGRTQGLEEAIARGGMQAQGISGVVGLRPGRAGLHRPRARAVASGRVGPGEQNSGRCSPEIKSLTGSVLALQDFLVSDSI